MYSIVTVTCPNGTVSQKLTEPLMGSIIDTTDEYIRVVEPPIVRPNHNLWLLFSYGVDIMGDVRGPVFDRPTHITIKQSFMVTEVSTSWRRC